MKTKVPVWASVLVVAVVFAVVGLAFWWYTGGKSEYESRHPSASEQAWRLSLAQSGRFEGPPAYMSKPAPPTKLEFSAQTVSVHLEDGKKITDLGRLYYKRGEKVRDDRNGPGGSRTTITRSDKGMMWEIYADRTYTASPGGMMRMGAGDEYVTDEGILRKDPSCRHVGTERVGGKLCDKYIQGDPGSAVTMWISRKIPGLCLRRVYQTESMSALLANLINAGTGPKPDIPVSVELRNVHLGRQPDSLFEVPKEYKRVAVNYMTGQPMPQRAPQGTVKPK